MPRKRKQEKQTRTFRADGKDVVVTFFPPDKRYRSWCAYWKGLPTKRSTKCRTFDGAVEAVERMLNGDNPYPSTNVMSDDEFDEIQRRHYKRIKAEPETISACEEAISMFREITGVCPITLATADDCAKFQDEAITLPKNFRVNYKNEDRRQERMADESVERYSVATVIKWSTALRAAFNRANANTGKKCIRNVVSREKLLTRNPWDEFSWIEDKSDAEVRQFTPDELASIIEFFEQNYSLVTVARLAAQTFFWSCARREEIAGLEWSRLRLVGEEVHFDMVGKWRVRKWFRIPARLYEELTAVRTDSPFVFAAYPDQVRLHHQSGPRPWLSEKVRADFAPENLGDWFYHRIVEWSETQADSTACVHVFRKTGLQHAVDGEAENRRVAEDARVTLRVMTTHYTREQERQLREKSNRTFDRIAKSLPLPVLLRYGYRPETVDSMQRDLEEAVRCQNWAEVQRLSELLRQRDQAG